MSARNPPDPHLPPLFFSGEGAFLPKWPLFLNRCEELFAACVVFLFFFFLSDDFCLMGSQTWSVEGHALKANLICLFRQGSSESVTNMNGWRLVYLAERAKVEM